ncbi:efflux RND transporter permease subunit [Paenibacillus sp. J2TS4]|uniref:efflux RND transporter permease subunit n=1 Tax=Paenibacillus sp. J2TS4 TaxID=2807194 RepID=UPI001B2B49A3|nr:efflux RND transporter permease subunit [Paenibacillus sp. J2TS4]GIP35712.1 multidrug transporter AcrB [Paenibacillus sp. J2TS4]
MESMTKFSMKNVAALIIMMLMLVGGGIYASSILKVESMPDISLPMVMVSTQYTAPPSDVLEHVTKPLEKTISGLEGLKNLNSTSSDNFSSIMIELEQGMDPEEAKREVESLVANVKMPQGAEKPRVQTFGFASSPVYYMSVYGEEGMNQAELDKIYRDVILPGFNSISGLDHVDSIGNQEAALTIKLDANAISHYGFTPAEVAGYIQSSIMSSPAGTVEFRGNNQMVRITGEFDSIYNLENLKLTTRKGEALILKDIASIEAISESKFIGRLDDKAAIGVHLYKTKSANAVEFGDAVDRMIEGWKVTHPNIAFQTIYNTATDIQNSINGMVQEGALGALLASIMILLFLRNVRMTLIVLVSIPLSILITLLVMAPLGISLNIMTLGGMAIAVGRVVDDSIVVIENIYSQLQKAQERNESVILMATKQVAVAITSSTITTVGVFGPLGFIGGMIGEIFRPFAITLGVALMSSLLVALTVIPMLAKLLVMRSKSVAKEYKVGRMALSYKSALNWSLKHRIKTLLLSGLLFILSIVLIVPNLAVSFMPESESDKHMYLMIDMPRETSMEMMDAKMKEIEAMMKEQQDVNGQSKFTYIESLVGYEFGDEAVPYKATMFTSVSEATDAKTALKELKDQIMYDMPKGSRVEGSLISFGGDGGGGADFSYLLKGEDTLVLQQAAAIVKEKLKEFPELTSVKDSLSESKTEVEVLVDQNKARIYGLTSAQVMQTVASWIGKENLGDLKFDNVLYKTVVELDDKYKNSLDSLGKIELTSPTGAKVFLNEIAKLRQIEAPVSIARDNQHQTLRVTATIESKNKGGVSAMVAAALNEIDLPSGVSREVSGVSDNINEGFADLFVAMAAAVFIVYLIMVLTFGNASAPFAILFSLPLAVIGGLLGLLITSESLNVTSLIGFMMLIGIVVTNAIVLIDRVQQLREENYTVREALVEGSMERLRPILMTAGATIFALMPLAMGMSKGALISKGLAVVVIGGLITSTILTLVIVPIVYDLIHSFNGRMARIFRREPKTSKRQLIAQSNISK